VCYVTITGNVQGLAQGWYSMLVCPNVAPIEKLQLKIK
jgi:hypothetical protein